MVTTTVFGSIKLTAQQRLSCGELYFRTAERYRKIGQRAVEPYLEDDVTSFFQADEWLPIYEPVANLFGHAIELYLKAYLMGIGFEADRLAKRPYSHSLVNLLKECENQNLRCSAESSAVVVKLNPSFSQYILRYPRPGEQQICLPSELEACCAELFKAVYPAIIQHARRIGKMVPPKVSD